MPDKLLNEPNSITYITLFFMIVFGGITGTASAVRISGQTFSWTFAAINLMTNIFFGIVAIFICMEYKLSFWAMGATAGVVAYYGPRVLLAFRYIHQIKKSGLVIEIKPKQESE